MNQTTVDRVRSIVERLAMRMDRQRRRWVLTDDAGSRPQEFRNLGQVAAFVVGCGGSCTRRLEDDDRRELQAIAVALGVPCKP